MRSMNEDLIKAVGAYVAERIFNDETKPRIVDIEEEFHIARGTAFKYLKAAEKRGYCSKFEKYNNKQFASGIVVDGTASCGTPTYERQISRSI